MNLKLKRNCLRDFQHWFERESGRKPLLIRGARQTGKTTAIRMFAEEYGLKLVELNMEKHWGFTSLIESNDPSKVIEAIEFELNCDIDPKTTLLFFDEVQAAPSLLALLRYFYEETPEYAVAATGSLLEFSLAAPEFSLPVGRIELYHLGPFSFEEFLAATDNARALEYICNFSLAVDVPDLVHEKLLKLARLYSIVGGMPESVAAFRATGSLRDVERIKAGIIETFILDFNKYGAKANPVLLKKIFGTLPVLAGRKVVYSNIDPQVRSKELATAFDQLCLAKVVSKVCHSAANGIPLAAERNDRFFKPLLLDVGLLLTQTHLNPIDVENVGDLNLVNNGSLAEQFIGQQMYGMLPHYRDPELYYWAREKRGASAEVDYLWVDEHAKIVPVEVKSGKTGSLRSLQTIIHEKSLIQAVRFNSDKPSVMRECRQTPKGKVDYRLISLPHYLVLQLNRLIAGVVD